jgi:signal transduction histidine kinase
MQRRQLVADIAHELRTPLSVIQANLEAMQDGVLPVDAEQIASLREETLLLSRLVADLRLLSLAEAGQLKLDLAAADLGDLVQRAVDRLRPEAEARGIALVAEVAAGLSPVPVDASRFNQIVGNLVDNALRYTPRGGRIVVATGLVNPSTGGLRLQGAFGPAAPEGSQAPAPTPAVTVTDTGSGIAPEDLPHVFDRFYRADKSRSRAGGGSGLGLAIVKQLVEAHGGRVWAESPVHLAAGDKGCGTRISFTLPTAK